MECRGQHWMANCFWVFGSCSTAKYFPSARCSSFRSRLTLPYESCFTQGLRGLAITRAVLLQILCLQKAETTGHLSSIIPIHILQTCPATELHDCSFCMHSSPYSLTLQDFVHTMLLLWAIWHKIWDGSGTLTLYDYIAAASRKRDWWGYLFSSHGKWVLFVAVRFEESGTGPGPILDKQFII